jgi:hypothetical protein
MTWPSTWPDLALMVAWLIGSTVAAIVLRIARRLIDWNWPEGYHSKRVHRYGVRDDQPDGDTTDDGR